MKNFKLVITLIIALTSLSVTAQLCTQDSRFTNAEYFATTQIDSLKNVTYTTAVNYLGVEQDLGMDFYFPKKSEDTMKKRPFILLIHGGGFIGGNRGRSMSYHCKEFAKRGFVVATMSYRLGFDQAITGDNAKAVYRAQQDTNKALDYVASQAEILNIDTSWVFLGGSSAGAITAHFTAYVSQLEWNQALPALEQELGSLNTSTAITLQGIYNNMGSVMPLAFMDGGLLPTVSFHGELDQMVPIDKSMITGIGSREIHKKLTQAGVCNDFTIVPNGGHDIYRDKAGLDFKINRVACFFKSLLCNNCIDFMARETVPAACAE